MKKLLCDRCGREFWAPTDWKNRVPMCPRCGNPMGGNKQAGKQQPSRALEPEDKSIYSRPAAARPGSRIKLESFPSMKFEKAREKIAEYLRRLDLGFKGFKDIPALNPDLKMSQANLDLSGIRIEIMIGQSQVDNNLRTDVMLSAFVCKIPEKKSLAFFRKLMSWNNFASDVAHFSINEEQRAVYLVHRYPVWAMEFEEFRYLIESATKVTLNALGQLAAEFELGPLEESYSKI